MTAWPGPIGAITLFVEDLEATERFYRDVFDLPIHFEDPNSVVFKFGQTVLNFLISSEGPDLIRPAIVAAPDGGTRFQFTLEVDDVDAKCAELAERDIRLLNGPMDRPWGIRTASFQDPSGYIWEIAH